MRPFARVAARRWRLLAAAAAFNLCLAAAAPGVHAADADYRARREAAATLFNDGKPLEALPLLEKLAAENPADHEMLVALAVCLVKHAATLGDLQAAGNERLRARELLNKAWQLGDTSTLARNLADLLEQLPAGGDVAFSDDPGVDQAMRAGEAAFSRGNFDEALNSYSKALEREPKNYTAMLFIGNTYDRQGRDAQAAEWYERAIGLQPDVEAAYRYYAYMLARKGELSRARSMLIHAAVAEPYNRIVWRELRAWAQLANVHINEVYVSVPADGTAPPGTDPPSREVVPVWDAYHATRRQWRSGSEFRQRYPAETHYRHSLAEEAAALTAAAQAADHLAQSGGAGANATKANPALELLLTLYQDGLIEPYVLFSLGDDGISRDYAAYREARRDRLEEYLSKLVVPSMP